MTPDDEVSVRLEEPRMEDGKALLVAGLMKTFKPTEMNDVPLLWKELIPLLGKIPGQVDRRAYGVVYNLKEGAGFAYLAGVEVSAASNIPDELNVVRIPELAYAVFPHPGHVSTLKDTVSTIFTEWLPASGLYIAQTDEEMPDLLERYGEGFDPATGTGDIEVWVPIRNRTRMITFASAPQA